MALIIRDAHENDLGEILEIYNDVVINTTAVYDEHPRTAAIQSEWFQIKLREKLPVLVAEVDKKVIAYCSYGQFRAWPGFNKTVEWSIYVAPDHRGKGIASQLLPSLIERAKLQGYHTIIGGIDATNVSSLKLHEKLGFKQTGYLPEVGRKFDRWLDLVFMQLILN